MTRRRWIADEVKGNRAALTGAQAAHLGRVLRARGGQEFDIVANGAVRRGRVASVTPERVEFELGEPVPAVAVPEIVLVLAVFKFDRMEWAIEKATELGVTGIVPLIAKRTDSHLASAAAKRVERWRRIAREASQQSRRAAEPEIAEPERLKDVVTIAADRRVVLSEVEEELSLKRAMAGCKPPLALAIGPEGGWTDEELREFQEHRWVAASLGANVLRAETAVIAAISVAMAEISAA